MLFLIPISLYTDKLVPLLVALAVLKGIPNLLRGTETVWDVSAHMSAMALGVLALIDEFGLVGYAGIPFVLLVAASRLYLDTLLEVGLYFL